MTINIDRRFFSIRLKYDILVDGVQEFMANTDIFDLPLKPQLSLYDLSENKILTIRTIPPRYFEYDFILADEENLELRSLENTDDIYSFNYKGHTHTVHFNSKDFVSIFKGNEKIADFIIEKKSDDYVVTCYHDNYKIIAIAITLAYGFTISKAKARRSY